MRTVTGCGVSATLSNFSAGRRRYAANKRLKAASCPSGTHRPAIEHLLSVVGGQRMNESPAILRSGRRRLRQEPRIRSLEGTLGVERLQPRFLRLLIKERRGHRSGGRQAIELLRLIDLKVHALRRQRHQRRQTLRPQQDADGIHLRADSQLQHRPGRSVSSAVTAVAALAGFPDCRTCQRRPGTTSCRGGLASAPSRTR